MVTASAEMDLTLGNNLNTRNWICTLTATQGDGTPLGLSSFKEQDMVKLCIGLGQEPPEGVLQLSNTEAVLAFQCYTNMMAALHHLTTVKVWQGKPIVLHILPLEARQVREYVARRSIHSSGTHKHVQIRGVGIWPLPSMPSQDKRLSEAQASMPQVELTWDVWDLNDNQLQEAVEALQTKTDWSEGAASQLASPQGNPRVPGGGGEGITDDGEVDPRREWGWRYGKPVPWPISPPPSCWCWMTPQYAQSWAEDGHSPYQYLHWWCHPWKDQGIFLTVASWGTVCQGPLPRGSGLGEYYPVTKGSHSG